MLLLYSVLCTHINETILPSIEEVPMEAVAGGVVEGVVELVPGLVDSAGPEESLEEDSWESLGVRLRADPSSPARAGVDHVGVASHVLGVQPPVPAAGERHLGPQSQWSTLIGPDQSRYCTLIGGSGADDMIRCHAQKESITS